MSEAKSPGAEYALPQSAENFGGAKPVEMVRPGEMTIEERKQDLAARIFALQQSKKIPQNFHLEFYTDEELSKLDTDTAAVVKELQTYSNQSEIIELVDNLELRHGQIYQLTADLDNYRLSDRQLVGSDFSSYLRARDINGLKHAVAQELTRLTELNDRWNIDYLKRQEEVLTTLTQDEQKQFFDNYQRIRDLKE